MRMNTSNERQLIISDDCDHYKQKFESEFEPEEAPMRRACTTTTTTTTTTTVTTVG